MQKQYLQKRGDIPTDYYSLQYYLGYNHISFITLNFAQLMFSDELIKGLFDTTYNISSTIYSGDSKKAMEGDYDDKQFHIYDLQNHIIKDNLQLLIREKEGDVANVVQTLNFQNYHYLRTKYINGIYEIINKYIKRYEDLRKGQHDKSQLRKHLQKQDWFVILFLLRNNASHADGLHTPIEIAPWIIKTQSKTYTYKNIVVKEGEPGHTIRYNNDELLELYDIINNYILNNRKVFTTTSTGTTIKELLPDII